MPKLTKKEFSTLTGVSIQYINEYIRRGNLVLSKGKLDSANEFNSRFISSKINREKDSGKKSGHTSNDRKSLTALEREKKTLDIEKTKKEIELLNTKDLKQKGESLPTGLIKPILVRQNWEMVNAFHQCANNLISDLTTHIGFERATAARKILIQEINQAAKNATAATLKDLDNLINEWRVNRGQGEKIN